MRSLAVIAMQVLGAPLHATPSGTPQFQLVVVPNGRLRLKALLWIPAGCRRCPAILFNHGRSDTPDQHVRDGTARKLGPTFARHGYVFLFLFRRGEGLSADQGPFITELLRREERRDGAGASDRLQLRLLTTDQLSDGMAGVAWLRRQPAVDPHRVAVVGHSFGGQLALLEAERDPSLQAVVAFGPAAASWKSSPLLQQRLIRAARKIDAPVLILHAANDYSTLPGRVVDAERARIGKPHALKIYPSYGHTAAQGHNFLYANPAIWDADVFTFLDRRLKQ